MKLKLIFKILFVALLLNACATSSTSDIEPTKIDMVKITELKLKLPSEIFSKKAVYFKDKNGKDVKINLFYTELKDQLTHNDGFLYTRERGRIVYESKEQKILVSIDLSSQLSYNSSSTPQYSLHVGNNVNDHATDLLSQIILLYSSNLTKIAGNTLIREVETETILGKTFKNVFHSTYEKDFYKNQLGFNMTYGVVSLNDFDGNLYVFDRFE